MFLRTWRFLTLLLVALDLGMAVCHALELPAKMLYPASLYLTLHRTLYVAFGAPNPGAFIDVGAVLAAVVLVFLARGRRPAFGLTLLGAVCLAAALATWFALVAPANEAMKSWVIDAPPADWARMRDQWEYTHLARFAMQLVGFAALTLSALVETPNERPREREPAERALTGSHV
jgi:hypothetical protein